MSRLPSDDQRDSAFRAYKEALFDAFVWCQVVEETVADLARAKRAPNGGREPRNFYALIEELEQHVDQRVYHDLHQLRKNRNEIVHRSSYITRILASAVEPEDYDDHMRDETPRLELIARAAGDLYGTLVSELDRDLQGDG